jgi:hypothetical protein
LTISNQSVAYPRARGISPATEAIGAEIADLEALIEERPARATTLRQAIEDLRQKQTNLQRATWRRTAAPDIALPAQEAYRAAVSDINEERFGARTSRPHGRPCELW